MILRNLCIQNSFYVSRKIDLTTDILFSKFPSQCRPELRIVAKITGASIGNGGCCAAISPPREAPRRDSSARICDKSATNCSYGERRGSLFAFMSFVRVPIAAISRFASPNFAPGIVLSLREISLLAGGDPLPAFDEHVKSVHLPARCLTVVFFIRCRSHVDLAFRARRR